MLGGEYNWYCWYMYRNQGAAFRGRKFRIFLEKAIIDVKYHSRPFLMEDFYIFIFLSFIVKEISVIFSLSFFVGKRLVLVFDPYNFRL